MIVDRLYGNFPFIDFYILLPIMYYVLFEKVNTDNVMILAIDTSRRKYTYSSNTEMDYEVL